jgi:hypothetical protein
MKSVVVALSVLVSGVAFGSQERRPVEVDSTHVLFCSPLVSIELERVNGRPQVLVLAYECTLGGIKGQSDSEEQAKEAQKRRG